MIKRAVANCAQAYCIVPTAHGENLSTGDILSPQKISDSSYSSVNKVANMRMDTLCSGLARSAMVLLIAVLPGCGSDAITGVGPGVIIYERDGFEGDGRIVVQDIADLGDIDGPCGGDWANCISSIALDAGWRAVLYERDGFDGDSLPVITDISDLGNIDAPGIGDWDDRASSIRVVAP